MLQLSTLIAHHARYIPERPAVVFEDARLDWRTFGVLMPLSSGSGPPLWLSAHEPALTEYETTP